MQSFLYAARAAVIEVGILITIIAFLSTIMVWAIALSYIIRF